MCPCQLDVEDQKQQDDQSINPSINPNVHLWHRHPVNQSVELGHITPSLDDSSDISTDQNHGFDDQTIEQTNDRSINQSEIQSNSQSNDQFAEPNDYFSYLALQKSLWSDLPDLTIEYHDLAYTINQPINHRSVSNMVTDVVDLFKSINQTINHFLNPSINQSVNQLHALQPTSGLIKPGTLTLLLTPPGHGRSTFLRALAGQLNDNRLSGDIFYNDQSFNQSIDRSGDRFRANKLVGMVGQNDCHLPLLTVRETLDFAVKNSAPDPDRLIKQVMNQLNSQSNDSFTDASIDQSINHSVNAFRSASPNRVQFLLDLLELNKAADTLVGDQSVRGISGGESKRLSIGEILQSNVRSMMLDEVTTGLDSTIACLIVRSLKKLTRVFNSSVVAGLLQPTPEVFCLFDRLIAMRHGQVVFDGPISDVASYFSSIGIPIPDDQDLSDFLSDFLGNPATVYYCVLHRASLRVENHEKADLYHGKITEIQQSLDDSNDQMNEPSSSSQNDDGPFKENMSTDQSIKPPLERKQSAAARGCDMSKSCAKSILDTADAKFPPLTTEALRHAFVNSKYYQQIIDQLNERVSDRELKQSNNQIMNSSSALPVVKMSDYTKLSYCSRYARPWWTHLSLCLQRAAVELVRNRSFFLPRVIVAAILGLILGGLFYQSPFGNYQEKLGLITYLTVTLAFRNGVEAPFASNAKYVVAKQCDAGFYPTSSYVLSTLVMNVPVSAAESIIMCCIVYWMTGFTVDVGRFFFFMLVIWLNSVVFSVLYRAAAWGTRTHIVAAQVTTPLVATFYLCSGYLILYDSFPRWLLGLYELSPFTWDLRSLALNEFYAPRYDVPSPVPHHAGLTLGEAYLRSYDLSTNRSYKWGGVLYLILFFIVVSLISWLILSRVRYPLSRGTRRIDDEEEAQRIFEGVQGGVSINPIHPNEPDSPHTDSVRQDLHNSVHISPVDMTEMSTFDPTEASHIRPRAASVTVARQRSRSVCRAEFAARYSASFRQPSFTALPFKRVNLAWKNIKYTVPTQKDGVTCDRTLVDHQSGFIAPGTLTALIGVTGAGKTTLLDVLAGRKTAGTIDGSILVNGYAKETQSFNRLASYCEQTDVHTSFLTVRESLMFSAHLRLSRSISEDVRKSFVADLLDTLELQSVADELVGNIDLPGISPGELKRLTIGVELAANPSVLFIDEPTSALDSHAALIVMRVIRKIANSGRSVLCTIHQPSQEVFFMFDRLLLLQDGGLTAYFGPVGPSGRDVVTYFSSEPFNFVKPAQTNPASWILDVIAPSNRENDPHHSTNIDFCKLYDRSSLRAHNESVLHQLAKPSINTPPLTFKHRYASSRIRQYFYLQIRHVLNQWRQPVSWFLVFIHAFLGLILGLLYTNAGEGTAQEVITKISAEFAGLLFPGWAIMLSTLTLLIGDRPVYYRERWSQIYDPSVYALVITVTEAFYTVAFVVIFLTFFYPLVGLTPTAEVFFKYFLAQYVVSLSFAAIGHLSAAISRDITMGNIIAALIGTLIMLFSGLFKLAGEMHPGFHWIYEINPLPKALIALTSIEFDCGDKCTIFRNQLSPTGVILGDISSFQFAMHYLDSQPSYWVQLGWIILIIVVLRILFFVAWSKVNFIKR